METDNVDLKVSSTCYDSEMDDGELFADTPLVYPRTFLYWIKNVMQNEICLAVRRAALIGNFRDLPKRV